MTTRIRNPECVVCFYFLEVGLWVKGFGGCCASWACAQCGLLDAHRMHFRLCDIHWRFHSIIRFTLLVADFLFALLYKMCLSCTRRCILKFPIIIITPFIYLFICSIASTDGNRRICHYYCLLDGGIKTVLSIADLLCFL